MASKKKSTKAKAVKKSAKSNREYKDGVFTTLYATRENILELYNALSDTSYPPDTNVTILTLKDVLYAVRKNDLAFGIDNRFIVLSEHQSTICANMPLRFLFYIPRVYEKIVDKKLLYSGTQLEIPIPEFYVFYNGTDDFPQESVQKLSDSFVVKSETITLELKITIININTNKEHPILKKCPTLAQYSLFVDKVRELVSSNFSRDEAIKQAIDWSIEHNVLKQFLTEHGSEVHNMLFEEYNINTALQVREAETFEKAKKEFALKMLKAGEPLEKIQLFTDLSSQQIEKLQKQLDNQLIHT